MSMDYPHINGEWVTFDVRRDPLDLRDRFYTPPLVSLPPVYPDDPATLLKQYAPLVRDQGADGACVGFGLAAMINYLRWSRSWRQKALLGFEVSPVAACADDSVSPRMIYHLARFYDHMTGENYSGSSCRAAMIGWHKHGVCKESDWKYADKFIEPGPNWKKTAAECTIGAYYRVADNSVRDMQAAIFENGAVFASCKTHDGWDLKQKKYTTLPQIKCAEGLTNRSHAFAMIGFNQDGFIIQNSYGTDWGYNGFAILTYGDWIKNRLDVWVAALGVPTFLGDPESDSSTVQTESIAGAVYRKRPFGATDPALSVQADSSTTAPWTDEQVYEHSVVINEYGQPVSRMISQKNATAAVERICNTNIVEARKKFRHIAVFAHSGLESETTAVRRASVLGPYFEANGVYPIFLSARSGFVEALSRMLNRTPPASMYGEGLDDAMRSLLGTQAVPKGEARDQRIELFGSKFIRPLWTQFRENASVSAKRGGAVFQIAKQLRQALEEDSKKPEPKVHLVGHSAGAILLGELVELFSRLKSPKLKAASCSLYAPACSVEFANQTFAKAIKNETLKLSSFHVDVLSDENELRDNVADVYGKSLLHLMSHALENRPRMPMLGLHESWDTDQEQLPSVFDEAGVKEVTDWRETISVKNKAKIAPTVHTDRFMTVATEGGEVPASHNLFDNNLETIETTLKRITSKKTLKHPIKSLRGF